MKQFKNLSEVIAFRPECPFCLSKLSPGMDMVYDENRTIAYLSIGGGQLKVDYCNNSIIEYSHKSNMGYSSLSGVIVGYNGSGGPLSTNGTDFRSLLISCIDCQKYSYLIQLHISLEQGRIANLILNSEFVSVEDGNKLYEIKNIYTTDKTEMSMFHTHLSKQRGALDKVEFPLVPLDLQNPMKTVERIKNLIVFL